MSNIENPFEKDDEITVTSSSGNIYTLSKDELQVNVDKFTGTLPV